MTLLEKIKDQVEFLNEEEKWELASSYVEQNSFEGLYKMDLEEICERYSNDPQELIRQTFRNEDFCMDDKYYTYDGYGYIESFDDLIDYYGLTDLAKFAIDNQDEFITILDFDLEEEEEEA